MIKRGSKCVEAQPRCGPAGAEADAGVGWVDGELDGEGEILGKGFQESVWENREELIRRRDVYKRQT